MTELDCAVSTERALPAEAWGVLLPGAPLAAIFSTMQTTLQKSDVAPEALRQARKALRDFPSCFWTRRNGVPVSDEADIRLVIRRLRQNGPVTAWKAAREIETCL